MTLNLDRSKKENAALTLGHRGYLSSSFSGKVWVMPEKVVDVFSCHYHTNVWINDYAFSVSM